MSEPFYLNRCVELWDAGASGGLMLEVRTGASGGHGEETHCVELEPAEVAGLEKALRGWLWNKYTEARAQKNQKDKPHGP